MYEAISVIKHPKSLNNPQSYKISLPQIENFKVHNQAFTAVIYSNVYLMLHKITHFVNETLKLHSFYMQ